MQTLYQSGEYRWIDCENPSQEELAQLEREYKLDSLLLADSLETGHLPKYENKESYEFLILRFYVKEKAFYHNIVRQYSNKLSIFRSKGFLITIHQQPVPFLEEVSKSLNEPASDEEQKVVQQIIYRIFKSIFETYKAPADRMAEQIDRFEGNLFIGNRKKLDLKAMYQIKREASSCKKVLTINHDALKELQYNRKESALYRDILELNQTMLHLHGQILEDVQNLMSFSLSISEQKANETMKVLTIFSAFFLPLSFIAGVYGMNFKWMPELEYTWGYPLTLLAMIATVVVIYILFKRKNIL